jgi:hypothetical protein
MATLEIKEVVLEHAPQESDELSLVVDRLVREARKKGVHAVRFRLDFDGGLRLDGEATDRGSTLVVSMAGQRRRYRLTVDGVQNALADLVRVVHHGAPEMLDAYERVLVRSMSRRE